MQSVSSPASIVVDTAAVVVLVFCTARGYRRGFSGELAHTIGLLVGLVLGLVAFEWSQAWLARETTLTDRPGAVRLAAIASATVATVVGILLVRSLLGRVLRLAIEEGPDRTGGALAGFFRGSLAVLTVFLLANLVPFPTVNRLFGEESFVGRPVARLLVRIEDALPDEVQAVRDGLHSVSPLATDSAATPAPSGNTSNSAPKSSR